jgi:hypothetical protein
MAADEPALHRFRNASHVYREERRKTVFPSITAWANFVLTAIAEGTDISHDRAVDRRKSGILISLNSLSYRPRPAAARGGQKSRGNPADINHYSRRFGLVTLKTRRLMILRRRVLRVKTLNAVASCMGRPGAAVAVAV